MTSPVAAPSLLARLRLLLRGSRVGSAGPPPAKSVRFQLLYERFREILALNDAVLQLIADMDEMRARRAADVVEALAPRIRRVAMDVFLMAKNLNQIADGRYPELYQVLKEINGRIEAELANRDTSAAGPAILRLDAIRLGDAPLVGGKMAPLGELRASGRWSVPDGFAVTTAAFVQFMNEAELWDQAERLEAIMATHGPAALPEACREVRQAVLRAPVPAAIAEALLGAYDDLAGGKPLAVAMRSSAVGEDESLSHAGQYHTELHVGRERLLDGYRRVVSSAYGASAVAYRQAHGLSVREARMAVGCMRMLSPRASGVLFSRAFEQPRRDVVVISATQGLAAGIVGGTQDAEELRVADGQLAAQSRLLSEAECRELARLARDLEAWRGKPMDIEWAIDPRGALFVLQARPLSTAVEEVAPAPELASGEAPIATGGQMACPGAAAGVVAAIRGERDLDHFPSGAVLVARHSSPRFARVMERCAAIVTEVGSPSGHMAILAREYQVPAIVGLSRALELLAAGVVVTVDATNRRVFAGRLDLPTSARPARVQADSPALQALRRLAELVTPLHLTDPSSPQFTAASCRSLHDVTRFVHEKVFEVMFHFGDLASSDRKNAVTLQAHLPLHVLLYDVGGGLSEAAASAGRAHIEDVVSVPGQAFLSGLSDPRIRWDHPRPLSGRGFLSVLGDGLAAPPPVAREVGRRSYAVLSDRYMNFSTKAGYHFSTVDTYCGASLGKNYIHFRFERGGAAGDRRARRVLFLSTVLRALDFTVQSRDDVLVGRLEKYDRETIQARLADLGRLTLCARQLDMLMDSDASAESYAQSFLAGEFTAF
jgi:pyruvate,water dikinase